MTCSLCNEIDSKELFPVFDESRQRFRLLKCRGCKIVFLDPQPSPEDLAQLYARDYYGRDHRRFEPMTECAVYLFTLWRSILLRFYLPSRAKVLEIGCGRGSLLGQLTQQGHDVFGTELNDLSAKRARQLLGNKIFVGNITGKSFPPESFDMVILWHVLEHLPQPRAIIRRAYEMLKKNGKVVIALPNFASFQSRWSRQNWFHLDIPRHLFHFQPETLIWLLEQENFRLIRRSSFSIEQNPFGILQSALNVLGQGNSTLYHILRRIHNPEGKSYGSFEKCICYIIYVLGMPPAILLSLLETLCGKGGTFYVIATKSEGN